MFNEVANHSSNAGSDYMSYTRLNYPAAFAAEGNPLAGGFPGDFDPYVHGVKDTMDVDDETGYFSLDVSLECIFLESSADVLVAHGKVLRAGDCLCCGARWLGQHMALREVLSLVVHSLPGVCKISAFGHLTTQFLFSYHLK